MCCHRGVAEVRVFLLVALACIAAFTAAGSAIADESSGSASAKAAPLGLNGYCAVCLAKGGKWVKGSAEHAVVFDGFTYRFPSENEKAAFLKSPETFAPVLNGDCVVCVVKAGVRMPGKLDHAVRHEGRIYLFPSAEQKEMFKDDPSAFANADLALGGNCAVCLTKAGKDVAGKAEFAARRDGWRYLFPSAKELKAFVSTPDQFVVSATGVTDCAACTYGVHPIAAPSELGLAVKVEPKQVLVVEDAHARYAEVYGKRMDGLTVSVVGTPIKSDGQFTWIRPTFLSVQE